MPNGIYQSPVFRRGGCIRLTPDAEEVREETLCSEISVRVFYNGKYAFELCCTPMNLEDLAYGCSFTRGVIAAPEDICSVRLVENAESSDSVDMEITLRPGLPAESVQKPLEPLKATGSGIPASAVRRVSESFPDFQIYNRETGAMHAAAYAGKDGEIIAFAEDIGRHNALDKLIGSVIRRVSDRSEGFVFLSSRCANELAEKVIRAGIPAVAAVSAPTMRAVALADRMGLTVCAFVRNGRLTIYSGEERILRNE